MSPTSLAVGLIIISAISHALVGVLLKRSNDKLVLRIVLGATSAAASLPFIFILPALPPEVWLVLALGISLLIIYQIAQASAFTRGDMSLVYPIMRGFAPALTAVFALFVLNESLSNVELGGLAIVVAALVGFGWPGRTPQKGFAAAVALALCVGALTSLYTVVDAKGIRLSPVKFSFIAWLFVLEGTIGATLFSIWKRKDLIEKIKLDARDGVLAGGLGIISYSTALYAFSLSAVAPLAALRESSVIFGAIFAALLLKEPFGKRRMSLAALLVAGLALMHMT